MAPSRVLGAVGIALAAMLTGCDLGAEGDPAATPSSDVSTAPVSATDPGTEADSGSEVEASHVAEPHEESEVPSESDGEGAEEFLGSSDDTAEGDVEPAPVETGVRPRFARPDSMKGLYVNSWAAGSSRRMSALIELARKTEINTFVIDVKDVTGHVSHRSSVPLAQSSGATDEIRIRDLAGLLRRLEAEGIYPVARIVIVKDSVLAHARPELAIQDTAGGMWYDSKGVTWLNLFQEEVWEYHLDLAAEVAQMGFPEVQWDYVRFPDARPSDMDRASFPGDTMGPRTEAVRRFLDYAGQRIDGLDLDVHMTADVFGVATSFPRVAGIGQEWEKMIDLVDAAHPMVYPSHYGAGSHGVDKPNAYPYEIVLSALEWAGRRNAAMEQAGDVRPWLQDFTMGSPRYEAPEVRAQIQATYDAGFTGWILWNPSTRYSEGALRPVGGFPEEPLIRVAGEIVPVSQRHAAAERVAAREQAVADSLRQVAEAAVVLPPTDTITAAPADTLTVQPVGAN